MKTRIALALCTIFLVHLTVISQVKIGDNATTINGASLLELETTNKGFVLPRVSITSAGSSSPLPAGLLIGTIVYNTNSATTGGSGIGIYYWDGSKWNFLASTTTSLNYWSLTGNSGTTAGTNFLGTTDGNALVFKVNNTQVGYFGVPGSVSSISLGAGSSLGSTAFQATAIGASAQATANNSLALGYSSSASIQDGIAIGDNAQAKTNNEAIAIGHNSTTTSYQGISLGISSASSNNQAIAIGTSSNASGYQGIAIGNSASAATNNNALAIGVGANATGFQSTAIGNGASASASNATAIGNGASAGTANTLILGNGANVGIGLANPAYKLSILTASNPLYLSGVQATATFSTDSLLTINAGVVKKTSYASLTGNFWSLIGNSATSAATNFIGTTDAVDFVARTSNLERLRITSAGNIGIGLTNPAYKLSVLSASNPLYLSGVQATGTFTTDSILTINAGVIKKAPYSALTGNFWSTVGNNGTSYATNFLGTTDNISLRMRTNNTERLVIDSTGSVGIGSTNFDPYLKEKLLVDYGNATTSNNIATFTGKINDYLQIGVQNKSNGANASSDFVATSDDGTDSTFYIDMGINSSTYAPSVDNFGGPHDGYLYTYSRNLIIGTQKASSDIIFLSGGGQTRYNAVLRMDGATGNIIIGRGENNTNATGNTIRGPNGNGTNIQGGSLTLQGGSATGTGTGGYLYLNGGTTSTGTAGNIVMSTASSERLRIDQSGNVGIGISNPSYKLSVLSSSNPLYLSGLQATSIFTSDSVLTINAGVVKKAPFSALTGNFWSLTGNTGLSASTNFIGTTDATDVVVKTNNTERMHILGSTVGSSKAGWTGMGVTLPRSSLDVTGDFTNKNVITIQNTSSTGYSSVDMIDNAGNLKSTFGYANSGTGAFFGSRAYFSTYGSDFVLTNNNGSNYNFFMDGTSGNVGVNTSTPSEGLDIADKNIIISNSTNTAGLLKFQEPSSSGSNYVAFKAPVTSANTTYTLPIADGSANQALTTNGSGTLAWSSVGMAYSVSSALSDPATTLGTLTYTFVGEVAVTTAVSDSLLLQGYFSAVSPSNKYLVVKIVRGTASGACGTCTTVAYSSGSQNQSSNYYSLPVVQQQSGLSAGTYYYKIYATGYTAATANYNLTVLKVH